MLREQLTLKNDLALHFQTSLKRAICFFLPLKKEPMLEKQLIVDK